MLTPRYCRSVVGFSAIVGQVAQKFLKNLKNLPTQVAAHSVLLQVRLRPNQLVFSGAGTPAFLVLLLETICQINPHGLHR